MLPREDNAFLGKALSCGYIGNSYDLSVFRQLSSNRTRHILRGREKQNCFCVIRELCRASPSLLGIYQKVSLKLTARAVPPEFSHHNSSAQCRKYFVEYFAHYSTLSLCRDYHANSFPCTNLRENEVCMLRWRIFQTVSLL